MAMAGKQTAASPGRHSGSRIRTVRLPRRGRRTPPPRLPPPVPEQHATDARPRGAVAGSGFPASPRHAASVPSATALNNPVHLRRLGNLAAVAAEADQGGGDPSGAQPPQQVHRAGNATTRRRARTAPNNSCLRADNPCTVRRETGLPGIPSGTARPRSARTLRTPSFRLRPPVHRPPDSPRRGRRRGPGRPASSGCTPSEHCRPRGGIQSGGVGDDPSRSSMTAS